MNYTFKREDTEEHHLKVNVLIFNASRKDLNQITGSQEVGNTESLEGKGRSRR